MAKTTSVYLSDEILAGLDETRLTVIQAIRAGIASHGIERKLLKAIGQSVVKIQAAVVCDCLGAPRGHLAGATPACSGKTAVMTPEDTAGITEPVEYYPADPYASEMDVPQ